MLGSRKAGVALGALMAAGLALTFTSASRPDAASLPTTASSRQIVAGYVNTVVRVGRAVYVGGEFGRIAPRTGSAIIVPKRGGRFERVRAEVGGGSVDSAVADGSGGCYLGGTFTTVGDARRHGLAHVMADGTPDPAFAAADFGEIKQMALDGEVLVVLSAKPNTMAVTHALDARTGAALPIAYARPQGAGEPRALLTSKGRLYAGFGNRRLAAYEAATGTRLWDRRFCGGCNNLDQGGVAAMAMHGPQLIVGGGRSLVLLDAASGTPERRVVHVPTFVLSVAVIDDTAYVAHDRSRQYSSGLSAVNLKTGRLRSWGAIRPSLVAADATTVYMAGRSTKDERRSKGFPLVRVYSARAGTPHATLHRVSPPFAGDALALLPQGGHLLVGGTFTGVGGVVRNNLAAFDAQTGRLLPWHPDAPDGGCCGTTALVAEGRTIYVAGRFNAVSGARRDGLAAVSAGGAGKVLPWHPRLSYSSIDELAVGAGRVFASGGVVFAGTKQSTDLAVFSARGAATHFRFEPRLPFEFDIDAMTVWHRTLIIGGPSVIAYAAHGDGRHKLWHRSTDSYVFAFATRGSTLYTGGNFDHVERRRRQNVAALALSRHGALLPFAPAVPIAVETLAFSGADLVFGGGDFDGHSPEVLGAVDVNGALEPWRFDVPPGFAQVNRVVKVGSGLFVAGDFAWLGPPGKQAAGAVAWLR